MQKKPFVLARLNMGNWIADCPIHGEGIAELVEPGKEFICSRCHPNIRAEIKMRHPQNLGTLISIPDLAMQALERRKAAEQGHVYQVIFPKDEAKIMAIVRLRSLLHMNWRPGMNLADLRRENKEYGVVNNARFSL